MASGDGGSYTFGFNDTTADHQCGRGALSREDPCLVPERQARLKFLEQVSVQLYGLLNRDENWAALAAIVDHLLAHERLEGEEIDEIMSTWLG